MTVELKNGKYHIVLDRVDPYPSSTGKTLIVASDRIKQTVGKDVLTVQVNCTIPNPDRTS